MSLNDIKIDFLKELKENLEPGESLSAGLETCFELLLKIEKLEARIKTLEDAKLAEVES